METESENSKSSVTWILEAMEWLLEILLKEHIKRGERKVYLLTDKRKARCKKLESKNLQILWNYENK